MQIARILSYESVLRGINFGDHVETDALAKIFCSQIAETQFDLAQDWTHRTNMKAQYMSLLFTA